MPNSSPIIPLYDYQKSWITDESRFKIGMLSRQTGKSFAGSLEAVRDSLIKPRSLWIFLSAGERQSRELMSKARMHSKAVNAALDFEQAEFRGGDDTIYKQLEIRYPNGSRIVGLPANPDTARGWSGDVLLDEFAIHKDSRDIWTSLFPTVTRGYKMRVLSTPKGRQNKFYELFTANKKYSKHKVTIHDAIAQGLKLRDEDGGTAKPEDLRLALGDDDAWQQEYLCEFLDEATAFLTYDMIGECESPTLSFDEPIEHPGARTVYAGVDIGRRRDLTVFWAFEQLGDVLWSRRFMTLKKRKFSEQREAIFAEIERLRPVRVCFDETGLGMQLAEEAEDAFGKYRIEKITFTNRCKEDMAVTTRRRFEDKLIRIPIDHRIREDLHSVKRVVTSAGNIRFDAERTEDGHADRFWALALAAHAASNPTGPVEVRSTAERESNKLFADYGDEHLDRWPPL